MWRNYLSVAKRNLVRNKLLSFLNIFGLALGMAVVLLIALYVLHEFSYDRFVPDKDNVYRVYRYWAKSDGRAVWTPSRLAEKVKTDFPEVEAATGLSPIGEQLVEYDNEKLYVEDMAMVDSTFLQALALPLKYGDPATALNQPNGLLLSDRLAKRLFGDVNPVGETVRLSGESDYQVTGVLDLKGRQTHLNYDAFLRFTWSSDSWTGNNRATYVRLQPGAAVPNLEGKITTTLTDLMRQEFLTSNYTPTADDFAQWRLQPLTDVHLHSADYNWIENQGGNIRNVYIFLLIAGLMLLVAIVNYVNLATAQATKRAKEVGVRKTSGALRSQLTGQFLTEALFQSVLAAAVGLLLAFALLPFFNTVVDRELRLLSAFLPLLLLCLAALALLTGLLAGFYPALVLSGFRPAQVLKTSVVKSGGKGGFRNVLVTGQFTVTIALLVFMAFIYRQVNYMLERELGFQPDQVLVIPLNFSSSHYRIESLKSTIEGIPGVRAVTTASRVPGQFMPDWGMMIQGRDNDINPYVIFGDADYAKTLDLKVVQGRFLSTDIAADTVSNFVVNEAFVKQHQIDDPIGAKVKFTFDEEYGQIVGVVKDFHILGLQNDIEPLVIGGRHERWIAAIQLSTANLSNTLFEIEKVWKQIEPDHPLRYSFLDEDFAGQYAEQQRFGRSMLYATLLTLFIAVLGLFGLAIFNVERRTKEIGVRKVLGATVTNIVGLLSKDFLRLVFIAFVLAAPLGWYATKLWLEDFAFRTPIAWWVFVLAGALALLVAFLTVSIQSVRAALTDPVASLRSE